MTKSTKIWLQFSCYGLLTSLLVITTFEAFPALRLFSNEGAIFGVMVGFMGAAIGRAFECDKNNSKARELKDV